MPMLTHRIGRGIVVPTHSQRRWQIGVGCQHHAPAALLPGLTRYPLYRRLGGPQGLVWTGTENLVHTEIRSPDRPARSQSLYRLSYPGRLSNQLSQITFLYFTDSNAKGLIFFLLSTYSFSVYIYFIFAAKILKNIIYTKKFCLLKARFKPNLRQKINITTTLNKFMSKVAVL